jgi:thioredoxin 1
MVDESSLSHVNDKNFSVEVLNANLPVLVDFWATWCGPCRSISPIVEELAKEFTGRVKVTKLNVDESPATPSQYGVRGIPTLILFKDGKILDQIVGAVPKTRLKAMIEKAL